MPGKARKVASRQGQLNRRRRKQQRGPSGFPPAGQLTVEVDERPSDGVATQQREPVASAPAAVEPNSIPDRPSRASPPRVSPRTRGERPDAYAYVRPEVRRILLMASTVLVALIVLGILL